MLQLRLILSHLSSLPAQWLPLSSHTRDGFRGTTEPQCCSLGCLGSDRATVTEQSNKRLQKWSANSNTITYKKYISNNWSKADKTLHRRGALPFKKLALPLGRSGPPPNTWFFGPISVHNPPTRHLDQFIRFCRAHGCDRQTYTHTQRPQNIGNNRPHLCLLLILLELLLFCSVINRLYLQKLL